MVRVAYRPLSPVLRARVPATVAEPLPVALHVTLQDPTPAVPAALNGLYVPNAIELALTVQVNATAARAVGSIADSSKVERSAIRILIIEPDHGIIPATSGS
jgi:hypothetical protein